MAASVVRALRERAEEAMGRVAREGDLALVRALARSGFLDDPALLDRQVERLRTANRIDAVLFLMDWRHGQGAAAGPSPRSARERFSLG